jgi:hypothetical protein
MGPTHPLSMESISLIISIHNYGKLNLVQRIFFIFIEISPYSCIVNMISFQTVYLTTMSGADSMDSHQADNCQNYITVIPVEYPRSRVYPQPPEYLVDQYR